MIFFCSITVCLFPPHSFKKQKSLLSASTNNINKAQNAFYITDFGALQCFCPRYFCIFDEFLCILWITIPPNEQIISYQKGNQPFMDKKNEESLQSLSPYFSPLFLSAFSAYSSRFKKERTRKEYLYAIASLCNSSGCSFFELRPEHIADYFQSSDLNSHGSCRAADSSDSPEPSSPLPAGERSLHYNLRVYRAFARFLDEHAEQYGLMPVYTGLFSSLRSLSEEMEFSLESLPSFEEINRVLDWIREANDLTTFTAVTLALRCALTVQELVSLRRSMFFLDSRGRTGLRLPVSDGRKSSGNAGARSRIVRVPDDAAEIIRLLTAGRPAGEESREQSLLLNKYGRPLTVRSLQMRLREACLACRIPVFTMHDLRTLGIAMMLRGGASVSQAAAYTGARNTDWFFRYNRIVAELDDSAADYSHLRILP